MRLRFRIQSLACLGLNSKQANGSPVRVGEMLIGEHLLQWVTQRVSSFADGLQEFVKSYAFRELLRSNPLLAARHVQDPKGFVDQFLLSVPIAKDLYREESKDN